VGDGVQKKSSSGGEDGSDYSMLDNEWIAWEEGIFDVFSFSLLANLQIVWREKKCEAYRIQSLCKTKRG
jgi:hypothetical protein